MARKVRLAAGLLVVHTMLAVTPTVSGGDLEPPPSSVLVIDGAPGRPAALWRVTPDGAVDKVVGTRWRPVTSPRRGLLAAVPSEASDEDGYAYSIVRPGTGSVRLPHRTSSSPCAAWSGDGRLLAYVSGEPETYGTRGTLWIVHRRSPRRPVAAGSGLFPECPAWSPEGHQLAYMVQSAGSDRLWELLVYEDHRSEVAGTIHTRVTSLMGPTKHRTFDWFPGDQTLVWIQNHAIHIFQGGETRRLTGPGVLRPIAELNENEALRVYRSLRLSPDGSLIAVGLGYGAGVFATDGSFVTAAKGILRGWAGNLGILTARPYRGVPSLLLHRAVQQSQPELVQKYSKQTVATSPEGDWFAYRAPHRRELVFRRPDGSLLSRVALDLTFGAWMGAGKAGRVSVPPWP
ncbi:MAG: hypothetical protein M3280_08205 [Actinomycetota bacterium]|nr:hypothetical protein [Actinomycetota bacterium]